MADAPASGAGDRKVVWVQVPSSAPDNKGCPQGQPLQTETYRSGHNEAHSKCVSPPGLEGSNPSVSAKQKKHHIRGASFVLSVNMHRMSICFCFVVYTKLRKTDRLEYTFCLFYTPCPPKQIETLRSIGCDYIQGYIWGRPLSAEDTEKLVTGKN